MNKRLILGLVFVVILSGCSTFSKDQNDLSGLTLENIKPVDLRLMANENFEVTHDEVMEKYRDYLEVAGDPEMQVRVHHRLANLRLQKDEYHFLNGGEEQSDEELAEAEAELGIRSIESYEELLARYPDRNDNDIALYQLAKAYSLAGEPFESIRVLEQLTELFPRSDYYLEALFRLGEMYYASALYDRAEQSYDKLIERGEEKNKYFLSAMYLKGWALFKQNRYDDSLIAFTDLLDYEFPDEQTLIDATEAQQSMLQDILRIMAITFEYQGDWKNIAQFFDTKGSRHYEYLVYDRMAEHYYDKDYYKSGASTLRAFVERYPDDVLAPAFYKRIVDGYAKAKYPTLLRKHKKHYIKRYGVGTEYWNAHNEAVRESIVPQLEQYIWDLARFNHAWGQRSRSKKEKNERLNEAISWYEEYIRSFPDAEDVADAHFLLAEIAYETGQYRLAKDHYEIVAYQFKQHEKAAEAGYAAILAFNKYNPTPEERAIWRQLTVASAMRFVQEFPEDERRGQVLVNTAEMLLADKYYEQALATARLAWESEGHLSERHRYGAALVRSHAGFELGYYPEAETSIQEALKYSKIRRKVKADLREKLAASIYKQGEAAKAAGNSEEAVAQWLRVGQVVPESDIKVSAEYDAATILMENKDYERAVKVLNDFRDRYPDHKLVKNIPSKLIVAYEDAENWGAAAKELQKIWQDGTDKEQSRIALFQSAEYFEKAGNDEDAIAMYKRYAHDYKRPFDPAIEAHNKLDQLYEKQGDGTKRLFWLNKIVWLHLGAGKDKTDRSKYLAAKAAYELGEVERSKFDRVKITQPLAKSIERKNKHMQDALERYKQSVGMEVLEYTTSATYRIAELYGRFSKGLMDSERPPGLDEIALEEYEFLLEDQAFPLEEAAIEIHQTNTNRTFDGLYDDWIKQSFDALSELMPAQYDKHEKQVTYVEAIR